MRTNAAKEKRDVKLLATARNMKGGHDRSAGVVIRRIWIYFDSKFELNPS